MDSWHPINLESQLDTIKAASFQKPQLIFKHSVRCGISAHIKHRLRDATAELNEKADLHYLDLINFRSVSNLVADSWGIIHQSPQVLLVRNGVVTYHNSHYSIEPAKILSEVSNMV